MTMFRVHAANGTFVDVVAKDAAEARAIAATKGISKIKKIKVKRDAKD